MNAQHLIGEVAKRHNVLVDPDDPILIVMTLNEILFADYVQKMQAAVEREQKSAVLATNQTIENAKRLASQIVSGGAAYVSEHVRVAGAALRKELERLVRESRQSAQKAMADAARHRKVSQWAAVVAIACAGMTLGLALALWLGGH
jgi:tRNA uridine 5-carbamoylmethylation protein Kti12